MPLRQGGGAIGEGSTATLLAIVYDEEESLLNRADALQTLADVLDQSPRVDNILVELSAMVELTGSELGRLVMELSARHAVGLPFEHLPRFGDSLQANEKSTLSRAGSPSWRLEFSDDDRVEAELLPHRTKMTLSLQPPPRHWVYLPSNQYQHS